MTHQPKLRWLQIVPLALMLFVHPEILFAAQTTDVRAAIEEANKDFILAISRANASALADMYAKEAKVLPPHSDILSGKQAIEQFWAAVIKSGVKGGALNTLDVEQKGKSVFETGTYTLTGEGGKVLDTGKYVVIWKSEKGKWKIHRDIWNTSMPAPKP